VGAHSLAIAAENNSAAALSTSLNNVAANGAATAAGLVDALGGTWDSRNLKIQIGPHFAVLSSHNVTLQVLSSTVASLQAQLSNVRFLVP
jgi:hypothetical protein